MSRLQMKSLKRFGWKCFRYNNNINKRYLSQVKREFLENFDEDPTTKKYFENQFRYNCTPLKQSNDDINRIMPKDNVAVLLKRLGDNDMDIDIVEIPKPPLPTGNMVLITPKNVGICGSDVEYLKHGVIGPFKVDQNMVCGHETGGEVIAIGPDVKHLKVGDQVALEPGISCGGCSNCQSGLYNLCSQVVFFATPPTVEMGGKMGVHGSMRTYFCRPDNWCFKIPDDKMDTSEAAWVEPLSVGIHACGENVANVSTNESVFIAGCGPIGIITLLCSIGNGANNIVITDIEQSKLNIVNEYIKENNFKCNVNTLNTKDLSLSTFIDKVTSYNNGYLFDHSFECVGNSHVFNQAFQCTKNDGKLTVIGMAAVPEMKVDISKCNFKENKITIQGVFRYRNTYPKAIKQISDGKLGNIKSLITKRANPYDRSTVINCMSDDELRNNVKIMFDF